MMKAQILHLEGEYLWKNPVVKPVLPYRRCSCILDMKPSQKEFGQAHVMDTDDFQTADVVLIYTLHTQARLCWLSLVVRMEDG
ncbi:hypothetical protein PoB_002103300 [Plakobranchus ocellatus]|uniref:Uncharacterized protein n=1 Tax=Plakobranchus ocellatus TaxID=259542 RepID=A0AAV3ZJ52_9GAST|nr:hypothetical protein PoB_002103300 [Plakobranchus ocellatus]